MSYPGESFVLGGSNSCLGTSDWESRTTGVIRTYDTGVTGNLIARKSWGVTSLPEGKGSGSSCVQNSYQALCWVLTISTISAES